MSKRAVDKLGFIRVLHKATGKVIPIAPKLFNNKERMMALGYMEITKPEPPKEEPQVEILNEKPQEEIVVEFKPEIEAQSEPQIKVKAPRKSRKKKTIKKEVDNGN